MRWVSGLPMMSTSTYGCTDTTLAMSFDIFWMQVGDVSLGKDEEILQQLLFSFRMVGAVSFVYFVQWYS